MFAQELLNSGYLTEVHKFSKFIHGTATLLPDMVQVHCSHSVNLALLRSAGLNGFCVHSRTTTDFAASQTSILLQHTCPIEHRIGIRSALDAALSVSAFRHATSHLHSACCAGRSLLGGRRVCAPFYAHVGTRTAGGGDVTDAGWTVVQACRWPCGSHHGRDVGTEAATAQSGTFTVCRLAWYQLSFPPARVSMYQHISMMSAAGSVRNPISYLMSLLGASKSAELENSHPVTHIHETNSVPSQEDELQHPLLGEEPTLQLLPDPTDVPGALIDALSSARSLCSEAGRCPIVCLASDDRQVMFRAPC